MTILIDPPAWPAHGTVFSHVVSDVSLSELHEFARRTGLSERAFDQDHYDVPAQRYAEMVAAGAEEVSGRELVRRLVRSGVRVPARQRSTRLVTALRLRWERLLPQAPELGEELLQRWGEEHRHYHSRAHLLAVLEALDALAEAGEDLGPDPRAVTLAAWFHDAVYAADPTRGRGADEEDSAVLAEQRLAGVAGVDPETVAEVARLVRLTVHHRPEPGDAAGAALSDADLAVLAGTEADYERYRSAVRRDYAHVTDEQWCAGRAEVLRSLLESPQLFHTRHGHMRWEAPARANLEAELTSLT
ncbi:MAG: DUF4031 domain-containing protein [Micrococcus sp.]|nr:DUF4031 domain-containing protein [Micrococcus sp.]